MPFEPLPGEVIFVPYGDTEALASVVDDTVAAVVLEPIQARTVLSCHPRFLAQAREICISMAPCCGWMSADRDGPLRRWLVHVDEGVVADIVTVAKGFGQWVSDGRLHATGPASRLLAPAATRTFGGNPVAPLRAGCDRVIERDGLLDHAMALGDHLATAIRGWIID